MAPPPLLLQTMYAELLERCAASSFSDAFSEKGVFTSKTVKGRRYWYFQLPTGADRIQRYVGPETPELLERISRHNDTRSDERERRSIASALVRFGMPRPDPAIANVVDALANAGVFRVRSVLVGTIAYQSYPAMLGEKLPSAALQTADIDIAQFASTSQAIEDRTIQVFDVLQSTGRTFRDVGKPARGAPSTSYRSQRGDLRIDFLTPNEGPETDEPVFLPALQTYAQPLRFLDFLIHKPEPAVLLHDAGIYVTVPAPERYALHKLIVAQRRRSSKREKDVHQAGALLTVLAQKRPSELDAAWGEATGRGKKWQELLHSGLGLLPQQPRDLTLRALRLVRSTVPDLDLTFRNPAPRYIFDRDVVAFVGAANEEKVACEISLEALGDHFGGEPRTEKGVIESFLRNRSEIEAMARIKYLEHPVEQPATVLLTTTDVPGLAGLGQGATRRAPRRR